MTAPVPTPPANAGEPPKPVPPVTAPALGAQPQPPEPAPVAPKADADKPLGEAGLKALKAERDRADAFEKELKALAPLKELAAKLGAVPAATPEDNTADRVAKLEADLKAERDTRLRLEVASEKQLTAAQAARLNGSTREELLADADALLALFPTAPATGTSAGQPADFGGGHRGTDVVPADLDAQIAAAEKAGNHLAAISLKRQRMLAKN
jgi:hypothetical protein